MHCSIDRISIPANAEHLTLWIYSLPSSWKKLRHLSCNQPIDEWMNQSVNQPTDQSINQSCLSFLCPIEIISDFLWFLTLSNMTNFVFVRSTHIVASCEMDLYEFPMDVQHCKLTFGSCKFAFHSIFPHLVTNILIKYPRLNYRLVGTLFVTRVR